MSAQSEVAKVSFDKMSGQLVAAENAPFGGAFVIVPPTGDPMEVLILDSRQDAGQFWGILQAKCAMALREIDLANNQAAFGGRR